jgi:chromosome partitioning protein
MPVIAVVNQKGGSGKSTLATHLAVWLARQGLLVMLGDMDRQQSARTWLKQRDPSLPTILPWTADHRGVLRPPAGVTHVILDTPAGMHGLELARVVMSADAVIMPVCNSMFDRDSAASCLTELMNLPRVASRKCRLGVVGMRIDARTHSAQTLRQWALSRQVLFLGVLRQTQAYVRGLESGQTVFDLVGSAAQVDLDQWEPILQWLRPIAQLAPAGEQTSLESRRANVATDDASVDRIPGARANSLRPAQESLAYGDLLSKFAKEHSGRGVVPPLTLGADSSNPFHSTPDYHSDALI